MESPGETAASMEMESTKKRTGLEMEEGNQEEESNDGSRRSTSPEPARKKKKIDPAQQMQTLFDFLRRYRREDGSELCETFIRAPKRRTEPGYYEVVTDPIDMLRIQQKLKMDEYGNMEELKEDFGKLLKNALSYYKKGSQEFKDAVELQDLFVKAAAKVEAGEDPSATLGNREESDENDMAEMLEDLFASVMTLMDTTDPERPLHLMFRLLPSQKRYPEYYKVITEPIDLKIIAGKIVDNKYEDLTQLEDDIGQMCKNAQMFNEPGSQIYRDARVIMKTVKQKSLSWRLPEWPEKTADRGQDHERLSKSDTLLMLPICSTKTAKVKKVLKAKKVSTKRIHSGLCSATSDTTKPTAVTPWLSPF